MKGREKRDKRREEKRKNRELMIEGKEKKG